MSDHPSADTLAMYALDAHDPNADRAVHAHVARCATCRAEVAALRESASLLAEHVPPRVPPPSLRDRVIADATRTPRTAAPVVPLPRPVRPAATRLWPVLAAASVLVAVAAGAAWWRVNADRQQLRSDLARVGALAEERARALAARDSVLASVFAPDIEIATLVATASEPTMRLYRDRSRGTLLVSAHRLPPAPDGQTYQLWGIGRDGRPTGLGTFNSAPDGSAVVVLTVAADARFDVSAVTREPVGGSASPTTTPFLVGRWGD